jgi:hypothetical protein
MTDSKVAEALLAFETLVEAKEAEWAAEDKAEGVFKAAVATRRAAIAALDEIDPAVRRAAMAMLSLPIGQRSL